MFTLWVIFSPAQQASADEVTVQVSPSDTPISDTSTVQITINSIQIKVNAAQSNLITSGQVESTAIIETIQSNVPNTDTQTAISIATSQEPISTAIADASTKIQTANQAIQTAQSAIETATVASTNVSNQEIIVSVAQSVVDSSTAEVAIKVIDLANASSAVDSQTAVVAIDTQNVQNAINAKTAADAVVASASSPGLEVTVYSDPQYGARPPVGAGTIVNQGVVPNVNFNWGSGRVMGGPNDRVQVHFTGQFTPDQTGTMWLTPQADDGTILTIGNQTLNNWVDKGGGGGTMTLPVTAGTPQPFDLWYYENGGGAFVILQYYTGSGWQIVPPSMFNRSNATPEQIATAQTAAQALNDANVTLVTSQSILNQNLTNLDTAQQNLTNSQSNLTQNLTNLTNEQQNLTNLQQTAMVTLQTANALADTATVAVQDAIIGMQNATQVTINYYAEQARIAAEAEAARQAAMAAEAARQAAVAQAQAEAAAQAKALADAQAKAAAEAQAKAEADAKAAAEAQAKAEADALAAQQAADAKAAQDAADAKAKADQDAANAKAEADKAAAEQAAKDQAAKNAQAAADAAKAEQAAKDQAAKDAQAKADAAKAASDKLIAEQAAKAEADKAKEAAIGVKPNSPDQLSDTVVKEAPKEVLVAHVQVDKPGVENGGIEFFGTKSAPQVVGEDGKLTPPAPPPGSGLPIPPDAITTTDTFIGQPGGTSFNAPDVAVPVILTPLTGAIAAVPGAEAVNQAFVAMANIGNDMSPVTRKKAKKILIITVAVAAIRRRFG